MKPRPTSITVISWFLIVTSLLGVFPLFMLLTSQDPQITQALAASKLPMPFFIAMAIGGMIAHLASGIGMLKGHNWGRFLYVSWSILGIVVGMGGILASNKSMLSMVPGAILFLIICYFLFKPTANQYFQGK